jgi:hypothetical protein
MMHARTKVYLVGFVGAIALGTLVPAKAQYYPPPNYGPPPGYGYDYPPPRYGYRSYPGADPNGCPPGYSLQGGNCAPYRGPVGGGWRTWNGCPPNYTIQGGVCQPYRGPYGPGAGYYYR